jgi:hypothetical protein
MVRLQHVSLTALFVLVRLVVELVALILYMIQVTLAASVMGFIFRRRRIVVLHAHRPFLDVILANKPPNP